MTSHQAKWHPVGSLCRFQTRYFATLQNLLGGQNKNGMEEKFEAIKLARNRDEVAQHRINLNSPTYIFVQNYSGIFYSKFPLWNYPAEVVYVFFSMFAILVIKYFLALPRTNGSHLKNRPGPKRNLYSIPTIPSIFRFELLVSGRVNIYIQISSNVMTTTNN